MVGPDDMYNPWYNVLVKQHTGTLQYQGNWNLFDQIILSPALLNKAGSRDYTTLKYWKSEVQRMPYLFQTEGKYKGSTRRTTAGGVWLDGFSDHLPTVGYLVKEQGENTTSAKLVKLPAYDEVQLKYIAECDAERSRFEKKDTMK